MSEYISRNEVYQKLHEAGGCDASDEWARGYDAGITEAIDIIDNIPPADVAPVGYGHWAKVEVDDVACVYCSICKAYAHPITETSHPEKFSYCPHCGAKMDESEDKNDV